MKSGYEYRPQSVCVCRHVGTGALPKRRAGARLVKRSKSEDIEVQGSG